MMKMLKSCPNNRTSFPRLFISHQNCINISDTTRKCNCSFKRLSWELSVMFQYILCVLVIGCCFNVYVHGQANQNGDENCETLPSTIHLIKGLFVDCFTAISQLII